MPSTKFYLHNTADSVPISPAISSGWTNPTSGFARGRLRTSTQTDTLTSVSFTEASDTDKDIIARQYLIPIQAGQAITAAQAIQFVAQFQEAVSGNNMNSAFAIRIVDSAGADRKVVRALIREANEFVISPTALTNRNNTSTSATGAYTTQEGDYLVVEIGAGGNPGNGVNHDFVLRLGDNGTFLTANDTGTTATDPNSPWVLLTDTLVVGKFSAHGTVTADAGVAGIGTALKAGVAESTGAATVAGTGAKIAAAVGSATAGATVDGAGTAVKSAVGQSSAEATVAGVGDFSGGGPPPPQPEFARYRSLMGTPMFYEVVAGAVTNSGEGSAEATATVAGIGRSTVAAVGVSTADATVEAIGRKTSAGVAASSADATVAATGRKTSAAVGASTADATVDGVGSYTSAAGSPGTSTADAIVVGVGASKAAAVGASTAGATVLGTGRETAAGVAASSGTATVEGVGGKQVQAVAQSTADVTVAGILRTRAAAVASSEATATVLAVTRSTAAAVGTVSVEVAVVGEGSGGAPGEPAPFNYLVLRRGRR